MCIVSFCIGNNYRDLTAASLCVRLLQTHLLHRSPPCFLKQRSIQPVWWWRLLCFSHRETCSHHKGSFAGHTHGIANSGADGSYWTVVILFGFGSGRRITYGHSVFNFGICIFIVLWLRADVFQIPCLHKALFVVRNLKRPTLHILTDRIFSGLYETSIQKFIV